MQLRQNLRFFWNRAIGHISTLLLSVIMGTIVWLIAINEVNPLITQDLQDTIPVEVRGLDESRLQPVQDISNEYVRLVLRAPKSSWDALRPRDISAYVDLRNMNAGAYDVPIHVEPRDPNIVVTEVQRGQLRVQLDAVITKTVPVEVAVMDSAEFGYSWHQPTISPTLVTAVGPASQVEQVAAAVAEIYLRGARNEVDRLESIQLVNRQNEQVVNVVAEPSEIEVNIPITRWPGQRAVAVRVKLTGQIAYGYRLGRVTATPSSMVLYGVVEALDQLSGVVETTPLSLEDANSSIRTTLDLILPEGVNAAEGNSVVVDAEILPIEDGKTIPLAPVVLSLEPGLKAEVAPDTVDVIVSGPLTLLSSLGPGDIYVFLDVNGRPPGNYVVRPEVAKPNDIHLEGVLPETVEVVITSTLTDTMTGTVTATVTSPLTMPITTSITAPITVPITTSITTTVPATATEAGLLPPTAPITPTVEIKD